MFFSDYFEGDLNGYVDFAELAEVTGKTAGQIRSRVGLVRPLYMKNFRIIKTVNYRYPEIIELYSKTVVCSCRSCGGMMEKRVYFEGRCPYCGSSDLTAQVISGQRLYFISDNVGRKPNNPVYYERSNLQAKRIGYAVGFGVELFFFLIFLIVFLTMVNNYNNEPYFREMLGRGITSYSLFRSGLLNAIILFAFALAAIVLTAPLTISRMITIESAQRYAKDFARYRGPFLTFRELDRIQKSKDPDSSVTPADRPRETNSKRPLSRLRRSDRRSGHRELPVRLLRKTDHGRYHKKIRQHRAPESCGIAIKNRRSALKKSRPFIIRSLC